MRKLLTFLLSLSFFLSNASAQNRETAALVVRVVDPQGAAVAGAKLKLYTRDDRVRLTVLTDAIGRYRFEGLAPWEYLVEVEAAGFARAPARSTHLASGDTSEIDLTLKIAAYREEVVVTASGTVQTVDEISKAITVVDTAEIEARDEFSIAEAVRTVAGLNVQQRGGPGSFTSIKMRGLRNEHTAVLIDGVRFRDAASPQGDASAFLADFTVTDIDRIEVLRGSGSSLYGSNAIGGLLNIVSNDGGGAPRGQFLFEGGGMGLFRGRAQTSGGVAGDRLTYSVGLSHVNVSDGLDGDDAARNTSGQGRVRFRMSPTTTVSARIYATDASVMLNESPQAVGSLPSSGIIEALPLSPEELARYESGIPVSDLNLDGANFIPSANDPDSEQESQFISTLVKFEQRPRESFGYTITYHGLATDRSLLEGPRGVTFFEPLGSTRSNFEGRIDTLQARMDMRKRYHFVTAGYEFENESLTNRSILGDPSADSNVNVSQRSNTFFIQDQLRLLEGTLHVSGGFRAQLFALKAPEFMPAEGSPYQGMDFESPGNAYTGDASLAYFFRDTDTKLRAHVGNGYRAPSLFERFGASFGPFGFAVFGDPLLDPERSIGFDVGFDQELAGNRLRASATVFYTRLQTIIIFDFSGAIDPSTDPFGRFGGYRNSDGGSARGLELGATAALPLGLHLSAAYTYTDADAPADLAEELPQAFAVPKHQFSVVATQRIGSDFYVNFDLTVSDSYLAPIFDSVTFASRAYRLEGIAKADLGASYSLPVSSVGSLRFYGRVDNLFDQRYFENGFRTAGRTGRAGVVLDF